jgi:hypothetical protein
LYITVDLRGVEVVKKGLYHGISQYIMSQCVPTFSSMAYSTFRGGGLVWSTYNFRGAVFTKTISSLFLVIIVRGHTLRLIEK